MVIENSKVLDHGGNALAEKSIDRIRSTAGVLLQQLSMNIGHEVPVESITPCLLGLFNMQDGLLIDMLQKQM